MITIAKDQPIRVACTGAGYFSRFHYDAWRRLDGVEPVGAMARTLEHAAATGLPAFNDLAQMIVTAKPDMLDIITPPETHLEFLRVAIDHGLKLVICQKPFCRNLEEAREAVALARENGMTVVVHENFRFQPWYRLIRDEIAAGSIGRLHQITFRLRTGDGQGANAYLDRQPYFQTMPRFLVHETAVHWIDTFRFLAGDPSWVFADLRKMNPVIAGEDAGHILFAHDNGVRTLFDGNRHLDHAAEIHRTTLGECLVEGTEGVLTLAGDGSVTHRAFGDVNGKAVLAARNWQGFAGDCVYALQKHVVDAVRHGAAIENDAESYLRVIEIEEAVYRSAQCGQVLEV